MESSPATANPLNDTGYWTTGPDRAPFRCLEEPQELEGALLAVRMPEARKRNQNSHPLSMVRVVLEEDDLVEAQKPGSRWLKNLNHEFGCRLELFEHPDYRGN